MASADLVSDLMKAAHFKRIGLVRTDCEICLGSNLEEAVEFGMALGPAGEIIRLAGAQGERLRPRVADSLRGLFAQYQRADGSIWAASSSWTVRGRV
jgi:hypothetical protein